MIVNLTEEQAQSIISVLMRGQDGNSTSNNRIVVLLRDALARERRASEARKSKPPVSQPPFQPSGSIARDWAGKRRSRTNE